MSDNLKATNPYTYDSLIIIEKTVYDLLANSPCPDLDEIIQQTHMHEFQVKAAIQLLYIKRLIPKEIYLDLLKDKHNKLI